MRKPRILEGSTFERDVTFLNTDGQPVTPTSARYRIDCLTTGTEVRAWTPLTPAPTVTLVIGGTADNTANDNRIIGYNRETEERQCVVENTDSSGNIGRKAFKWDVVNLAGVATNR